MLTVIFTILILIFPLLYRFAIALFSYCIINVSSINQFEKIIFLCSSLGLKSYSYLNTI